MEQLGVGGCQTWLRGRYNEDFKPGFLVRHLVKDIRLAQEEADRNGVYLPGLEVARRLYEIIRKKRAIGEAGNTGALSSATTPNRGVS